MKFSKRVRTIRFAALIGTTLALTDLSACLNTPAEVCGRQFPEFDRKVEDALSLLGTGPSGRSPASWDRDNWLRWAELRLVEAQRAIDELDGVPSQSQVRQELSDIAAAFVSFHGYVRQGKTAFMARTLEQIREHSAKARGLACPAAQASVETPTPKV